MRTPILAVAALAMACGRYTSSATVTISVSGPGAVRTTALQGDCRTTCWFTVDREVPVHLEPVAEEHSVFTGWTGGCSGTGPCELKPGYDVSVAASFRPGTPRRLQVSLNGAGEVRSDPPGIDCPRACAADFPDGTPVTLQPSPASGWSFTGFDGACAGSSCRIEMFGDVAANATFLRSAVELAVDVSGPGTIVSRPAAISCPGVCSAAFAPDTAVTLIATAAPGASFSGFSDGCGGGACSLNLTAGVHVAASFRTIPSFKVSVTPAGAGIGRVVSTPAGIDCPGACEASFPEGTALNLSATADALSRFAGFEGACAGSQCAGTLRAALPVVARFDQRRYSLVDLGVPGGANWTAAAGISRQGQRVTGIWGEANGLFVWDGALHTEPIAPASAGAINSAGTVVGSFNFGRVDAHAFRWDSGQAADLGTLGGASSAAYAVNDQGIVVGWALRADGVQRAASWGANGVVDLGSLTKGGCSVARGVNSKGIIVGSSCTVAAGVRGARFRGPDEIDDLGSLGGTTVATAISDSGIIVGYSYVPSGVYHAFVYADGKMIDAGTLPGTDRSQLSAVNSAGVAVGDSSNEGDPTPVIYAGGRLADLAALVDTTAYTLGSASGIDEEGNIVATARLSGWWRAVLLRPK